MKLRYKYLLFILLLALPVSACGGEATPTNTDSSDSVTIPSPTPESSSTTLAPETSSTTSTSERPVYGQTSESIPTPQLDLPIITIKGTRVNIRSGPGTDYPIIQTLDQNDTAPATGFNTGQTWVQIKLPNGKTGWVSADLVDIDNPSEISIVTNTSPVPVATAASQQPPSSEDNEVVSGGNTGVVSGGNTGTPFQCVGGCATPPDPSCVIKGNVNSSGEKIYHMPSGAFYDRTDIKPDEGDRWFCTTTEAEEAGFRLSSK